MEPHEQEKNRNPDGTFVKGVSGNPGGRPIGSISPITMLKNMFAEDPEDFRAFVKRYKENPQNEKHLVEMLDGKAEQKTDMTLRGDETAPVLVKFLDDNRNPG